MILIDSCFLGSSLMELPFFVFNVVETNHLYNFGASPASLPNCWIHQIFTNTAPCRHTRPFTDDVPLIEFHYTRDFGIVKFALRNYVKRHKKLHCNVKIVLNPYIHFIKIFSLHRCKRSNKTKPIDLRTFFLVQPLTTHRLHHKIQYCYRYGTFFEIFPWKCPVFRS